MKTRLRKIYLSMFVVETGEIQVEKLPVPVEIPDGQELTIQLSQSPYRTRIGYGAYFAKKEAVKDAQKRIQAAMMKNQREYNRLIELQNAFK